MIASPQPANPLAKSPHITTLFSFTAFLLGVALPVSNQLMNLSLVIVLLCLLWQRDVRHLQRLAMHPLVWLPALMFAFLALSLLIHSHAYGADMVGKYKKLLYVLPLALFFLQVPQAVDRFVSGFLLANALILLLSLAVGVLHLPIGHIRPLNPTVFKLHITQNFFMALAALLWLFRACLSGGMKRWIYGTLGVLASYDVLFMVLGRTGYVALFVGVGVWLLLFLGWRQKLAVGLLGFCVLCALVLVPNRAAERITRGVSEIQNCVMQVKGDAYDSCASSMGERTAFAKESIRLIAQAPLLGNGAGSFWYGDLDSGKSVNNPHNQYLLETVQSGLVGLLLFILWMLCCYREAWRQPVPARQLLIALLSTYLACHLFNSFLLDSAEGHLFVVIAAVLAGKAVSAQARRLDSEHPPLSTSP